MYALKVTLIVLLCLVGLGAILGLIAPREVSLSRSTVIEAPQAAVFNTVNDLKTWEDWSPWKEMDPEMKVTMGTPSVGQGAYYSWTGENSGTGRMRIETSDPPRALTTHIAFDGQGEADAAWSFEAVEGGTKATWAFHTRFPYPFNAMLLFQDFEEAIARDYDRGLELLKAKVEAEAESTSAYEVKVVPLPLRHFIALRSKTPMAELAATYARNLPKVYQAVQQHGLEMGGMPCGLYYTWDESKGETDAAQAIPVRVPKRLDGFQSITLEQEEALLIEHYGSYDGLGGAHRAMEAHIKWHGLEAAVPAIEEYVTDPEKEPDTSKWLTRVYYPLAAKN